MNKTAFSPGPTWGFDSAVQQQMHFPTEDHRRHERGGEPAISVAFEGTSYSAVNWSLGGMLIEGYRGSLTSGALFNIFEIGPFGGRMTSVEVRARVVRIDPVTLQLVVSFLDLDNNAYRLLQAFMAQRMFAI